MSKQPESLFSNRVQKALSRRGAFVWKVHGNEFTPAGLPDIVGTYRGRFIGVESKMPGNHLSEIQKYRIGKIREAGGFVAGPCYAVATALEMIDCIDALIDGGSVEMITHLSTHYGDGRGIPR